MKKKKQTMKLNSCLDERRVSVVVGPRWKTGEKSRLSSCFTECLSICARTFEDTMQTDSWRKRSFSEGNICLPFNQTAVAVQDCPNTVYLVFLQEYLYIVRATKFENDMIWFYCHVFFFLRRKN